LIPSILAIVFPFIGGIGLFLIGMMLLSDGLLAFGGDTVKQGLARFTGTPVKAFASGTLATMVLQSSTATTFTMIGFVSSGLIGFSQAIGVLIGASLGNTATGWLVAGLGLKINLGFYTLPLIGIGALLKLLGHGRLQALGMAMAGFGLMFVGLNTLQNGMQEVAGVVDLAAVPVGGIGARLLAMLAGLAITVLLHSSTAAIATFLAALHTDTISFDQAAALVVGAAIGTTLTGSLSAIGGTIYAKRTALAYILFNAVVGLIAIALLPMFLHTIEWLEDHAGLSVGAMSLAAFHTLFISVGVLLFLPFVEPFAKLVQRILPARGAVLTQRLDASLLSIPSVALEASERALESISGRMLVLYGTMLSGSGRASLGPRLAQTAQTLDEIYDFISRIQLAPDDQAGADQRVAQLHAIDHLLRFRLRMHDLLEAGVDLSDPVYDWAIDGSKQIIALARQGLAQKDLGAFTAELEAEAEKLTERAHHHRHNALAHALPGIATTAQVLTRTDTFRWLERIGHHIVRTCAYLAQGRPADPATDAAARPDPKTTPVANEGPVEQATAGQL